MRGINKVVFAAPPSFQESGIESVATLAADFRSSSTRLPHLLRVFFARFPGETVIERSQTVPTDVILRAVYLTSTFVVRGIRLIILAVREVLHSLEKFQNMLPLV